ncbi:hypothetical protein PR202_ga08884 [Eleusine coracana subsp. coracana]|uniref:Uncharacterized protein n=1 Tax=Eleusine coracana subsp. coracana TaxID=191504 RepID=A0AAV5C3E8_ELECO|nr:hypothetical protein PR202_ga08884 [Eleusine coracana subsp. coracana]
MSWERYWCLKDSLLLWIVVVVPSFGQESRPYPVLNALSVRKEHACPRSMVGWASVTLDYRTLAY